MATNLQYEFVCIDKDLEVNPEDVNLALGRPTWQFAADNGSQAVDGNASPIFSDGACSRSGYGEYPWWAVDLGQSYQISKITIVNYDSNDGKYWKHQWLSARLQYP